MCSPSIGAGPPSGGRVRAELRGMTRLAQPARDRVHRVLEQADRLRVRIGGELARARARRRTARCCASSAPIASAVVICRGRRVAAVHDLADELAVLRAFDDRRDARVVVAVDAERLAHAREVGVGGRRADAPAVAEAERPEVLRRSSTAATPSASCSTSLPAASAQRNDTTASSIASCTCVPAARAFAREERGGDRLRGVQRGDLVGRGLVEEARLAGRRRRPGSRRSRRTPGSPCRTRPCPRTGRPARSPRATRRRRAR